MSKQNTQNESIPFRLVAISTEEFATFKANFSDTTDMGIDFGLDVKVNPKEQVVGIFTRFDFTQERKQVMVLESACHFNIEPRYWASKSQDGKVTLPANLLTHFLVLAVGTARGIIHAKKPLWFKEFVLPPFNVSTFIKEDMVFSIEDEA